MALCVGSLAPDLEFLRQPPRAGIGHTLVGQLVFCLPLSIAITWLFSRFVGPQLALRLPRTRRWRVEDCGHTLNPFASARAFTIVAGSALLGSLSHLLLDGFTHKGTWFSRLLPVLGRNIVISDTPISIARLLQYALSLVGATISLWLFDRLLARGAPDPGPAPPQSPDSPSTRGNARVVWVTLSFAVLGLVTSRSTIAHPDRYFELGRVYVWGYVLFRMCAFGFLGLSVSLIGLSGASAIGRD